MEASINLNFKSPKDAKAALKVIESEKIERSRSKIELRAEGANLAMRITASDLPALRAAINTYLRLASVITTGLEA